MSFSNVEYILQRSRLNSIRDCLRNASRFIAQRNYAKAHTQLSLCIQSIEASTDASIDEAYLLTTLLSFEDQHKPIQKDTILNLCVRMQYTDLCRQCLEKGADPLYQQRSKYSYPSALMAAAHAAKTYQIACGQAGKDLKEADADVAVFVVFAMLVGNAAWWMAHRNHYQSEQKDARAQDYNDALDIWDNELDLCRQDPPHKAILESVAESLEEDTGSESSQQRPPTPSWVSPARKNHGDETKDNSVGPMAQPSKSWLKGAVHALSSFCVYGPGFHSDDTSSHLKSD